MKHKKPKVAVICGGRSPEKEVSLNSGKNAYKSVKKAGYPAVILDGNENLLYNLKKHRVKVAFIALHGAFGEDGTLQGLLEFAGVPYTGSGVLSSALAMNKVKSKHVFKSSGIPTPFWFTIKSIDFKTNRMEFCKSKIKKLNLSYPVMVKPATLGSTIGVTKVKTESQLTQAIKKAFKYDSEILIEEFISGKEITVPIFGKDSPRALPVIEIIPKGEFYTYYTKYEPGMSDHIIPARLSKDVYKKAQTLGVLAHQSLNCFGFSRVDMMVKGNAIYVLEVNTIPGMTGTSLFPESAAKAGISFTEVVDKLITWGMERHRKIKKMLDFRH